MTVLKKDVAAKKTAAAKPSKATSKAAPKPAAKPTVKAAAKPPVKPAAAPAAKTVPAKTPKAKKPKMIRDSFTFPKAEYAVLDGLKLRAAKLGNPIKKTELLRAGIKAIAAMQDAAFMAALKAVPSLKTGRPAKVD